MLPVSFRRGRLALAAVFLALPAVTAVAQVRSPDRAARVRRTVPERRTELTVGIGRQRLEPQNALSTATIASIALRRQFRPEWLYLGARADLGSTDVDGAFFAPERRTVGDTTRFVLVGQSARWTALWATADILVDLDENYRYRTGLSTGIGLYGILPSRSPAPGTGNQFGPAAKIGFLGAADITRRLGVEAGIDGAFFFGVDRERLRGSDPALADPNLTGPAGRVPPPKDGVNGTLRLHVGLTWRFGTRRRER